MGQKLLYMACQDVLSIERRFYLARTDSLLLYLLLLDCGARVCNGLDAAFDRSSIIFIMRFTCHLKMMTVVFVRALLRVTCRALHHV